MSALSTPGGGGSTANKPTSGKQKFQKLDINSLYCANRGESSEPSSVKSQLSRKHGMQSLGKVPSARRPPANLPSLKTETGGQDTNANPIPTTSTVTTAPAICPQPTAPPASAVPASATWGSLPPPASSNFRNEFPTLEASAQPQHRTEPQLRPQTEGSWTSGGANRDATPSASPLSSTHTPAYHSIMPPFLVKGSIGGAGGASGATTSTGLANAATSAAPPRSPRRAQPPPQTPTARLPDALQRPILRQEQLTSLDEIARDPGWAAAQDIDYDQNLAFSDEESNTPSTNNKSNKTHERRQQHEIILNKADLVDDEKIWAERRQKQNTEVQLAVARAKQRKEEEQRRQGWIDQEEKDRARTERDRSERENDRNERERDQHSERDWNERMDREQRHDRERAERDRNEREDRERIDRDQPERDRHDRNERERPERVDRDRNERDRDFRDRDYGREQHTSYSKNFQTNMPPRFLKAQQQSQHQQRSQEDKNWQRRDTRRPYREFNEDDGFRREKDTNPLWRTDSQENDKSGKDYNRQTSKESFTDHRKGEMERKSDTEVVGNSRTSAAEKLSEVFDKKCAGIDVAEKESNKRAERKITPPSQSHAKSSPRSSVEKEFVSVSWNDSQFGIVEKSSSVTSGKSDVSSLKSDSKADSSNEKSIINEPIKGESQETNKPIGQSLSTHSGRQSTPPVHSFKHQDSKSEGSQSQSQFQPESKMKKEDQRIHHQKQHDNRSFYQNNETGKHDKDHSAKEKTPGLPEAKSNAYNSAPTSSTELQKRGSKDFGTVKSEVILNEPKNHKDKVERKSSTSSNEKRSNRSYGGYPIYIRGRDGRGRRPNRTSRSKNRASESEGSPDNHAAGMEQRDKKRAPRSPRGPKKTDQNPSSTTGEAKASNAQIHFENREAFAPRGQPSRRGRGGFHDRPPPPAKRVAGYGPPNTKSPFPPARARNGEESNAQTGESDKGRPKPNNRSDRGRDRRNRPPPNIEDENWETTSEHSEGGTSRRKHGGKAFNRTSGPRGPNTKGTNPKVGGHFRGTQNKKETDITETTEPVVDMKTAVPKKDGSHEDGFQEVRNKKTVKDPRVAGSQQPIKEENTGAVTKTQKPQSGPPQSCSQRNGNTGRNNIEKTSQPVRGSVPPPAKPSSAQYDRNRQSVLAPRFVKQRQKQQMTLGQPFGIDVSVAPPPPAVNAWDKPISQALRGHSEEAPSEPSVQRSAPATALPPAEMKPVVAPIAVTPEKTNLLDGTTPPVETLIFENTNYKSTPSDLKQKFNPASVQQKCMQEEALSYNAADNNAQRRALAELIANSGRSMQNEAVEAHMNSYEPQTKPEDSSDMKLDFAFDSDLGHLSEDKNKNLSMVRGNNTISPLAADLNLKIASVKKVWENVQMPAVVESAEELHNQLNNLDQEDAPPNVCKVKPTQQLQSPPPNQYNAAVGYNYTGLSVPSPPTMLFNSSQQTGLYGAFLDQSRGQFSAFPAAPYSASYSYQPPPDMFQALPNQYRMAAAAAAGGGAGFGQTTQLGNNPNTVLISSSTNTLMSASVKPSNQQIGAIGSKNAAAAYYGDATAAAYGGVLPGILPRASYYGPYQPPAQPPPAYPMQLQPAQSPGFQSQFLSSQLQVAAAAVQQMHQYRGFAPRGPPPLKSPLHENGFGSFADVGSPKQQPPPPPPPAASHSPPHHKYPPPSHTMPPPQYNMNQQMNVNRAAAAARYPPPIQRPPTYNRGPPPQQQQQHQQQQQQRGPRQHNTPYYHHNTRGNGGNAVDQTGVNEATPGDNENQQNDVKTESAHA